MNNYFLPCVDCGNRQRVYFDTDGNGRLTETRAPCGACASSHEPPPQEEPLSAAERTDYYRAFGAAVE